MATIIAELEEGRRDALVAYYLGQIVPADDTTILRRILTSEDLYEYLLLDNQVSGKVDTSRIAQAIASIQQHINAIFNGMEPGYVGVFKKELLELWRKRMSEYSIWAGNQMLQDYPENYIDPTLRLGATTIFKELEGELNQSRITSDSVQAATLNYLNKFELISNLRVLSGYIDGTDFRESDYYFIGRQNVEPFGLYWRKAKVRLNDESTALNPTAWTEWLPINIPAGGEVGQIRPLVIAGRLYLAWVEWSAQLKDSEGKEVKAESFKIQLVYKLLNNSWSVPMTLYEGEGATQEFLFAAVMDVRIETAPRVLITFYPEVKAAELEGEEKSEVKLPDGAAVLAFDTRFNPIELTDVEKSTIGSLVSGSFREPDALQHPFTGSGHEVESIERNQNQEDGKCDPPWGINQELSLSVRLLDNPDSEEGGILVFDGSCSAWRLKLVLVGVFFSNIHATIRKGDTTPKGNATPFDTLRITTDANDRVVAVYTISELSDDKTSGEWKFRDQVVGSFEASDFVPDGAFRSKVTVPLDISADELTALSDTEIINGSPFTLVANQKNLSPSGYGNRVDVRFVPISTEFKFEQETKPGEWTTKWEKQLTLNGGARMPAQFLSYDGKSMTSTFRFGVMGTSLGLGYNEYTLKLRGKSLSSPKIERQSNGAQFLNLGTLEIAGLKYVRLNTLFANELVAAAMISTDAVLDWRTQHIKEPSQPESNTEENVDFKGANGRYFWELFFHLPHLVAHRLHQEFNYLEAEEYLHYIFNPQAEYKPDGDPPSPPYWAVRPLLEPGDSSYEINGPVDPDAIAYSEPEHYRKTIFSAYIRNLIARGDGLYRRLTRDTLNEAKLLYVRALSLLGSAPTARGIGRWQPISLEKAAQPSNEELATFESAFVLEVNNLLPQVADMPWLRMLDSPYFRLPTNTALLELWEKIALRLSNLRNNLTLDGKPLSLPLYAPPANPTDLLRAQDGSGSLGQRHIGGLLFIPPYRFRAMLPRTQNAVETLCRFGDQVRMFMEQRDRGEQEELQQSHLLELSKYAETLQNEAIEMALESKKALEASKAVIQERFDYYAKLRDEDVSRDELDAGSKQVSAHATSSSASSFHATAAAVDTAPNVFGLANGGMHFGAPVQAIALAVEMSASNLLLDQSILLTHDQQRRRRVEWEFMRDQAASELDAIDAQIAGQELTIQSARTSMEQAQRAQQQAQDLYTFLKSRATGVSFYRWLLGQLSTLYFQTYDAVTSLCLSTEACWQYEMGDFSTRFIQPNVWLDNYNGLTAGEALKFGLLRMESAFLHRDERRLELTKTISLKELLGDKWEEKLDALVSEGTLDFELPQWLFDQDYPGHYLRQIASLSVSLPAVIGPYQNVRALLMQVSSKTMLKADIKAVKYLYGVEGGSNADIIFNLRANQQIGLSTGIDDHGMFTLNFGDERYFPFEGTGAVSEWRLQFPRASSDHQQQILTSLNDIIIHVRYLASDGGPTFAGEVEGLLEQEGPWNPTETALQNCIQINLLDSGCARARL